MTSEKYFQNYSNHLLEFCREGFLCDTIVVAGGKAVKVHSVLLAAASTDLRRELNEQAECEIRCIYMSNMDYESLCVAIYFIYTGNLVLPPGRSDEYYAVLKTSLINHGLDAARIGQCQVTYERNNELQFKSMKSSKVRNDTEYDSDDNDDEENMDLAKKFEKERQSRIKKKLNRRGVKNKPKEISSKNPSSSSSQVWTGKINGVMDSSSVVVESVCDFSDIPVDYQNRSAGLSEAVEVVEDIEVDNKGSIVVLLDGCRVLGEIESLPSDLCCITDSKWQDVCKVKEEVDYQYTAESGLDRNFHLDSVDDIEEDVGRLLEKGLESQVDSPAHSVSAVRRKASSRSCHVKKTRSRTGSQLVYQCSMCAESFSTSTDFTKHKKSHLSSEDRSPASQRRVAAVRESRKKYLCDKCDKKFALLSELSLHMTIHTDERPYECSVCGHRSKTKGALTCHMVKHSAGKCSMLCDICGKQFNSMFTMRKHVSRPHLEFKCDICGEATFYTKMKRAEHMLVDHGVRISCRSNNSAAVSDEPKPYLCSTCGRSFFTVKSYLTHRLEHRRQCSGCSERFEGETELREHYSVAHPGEECPRHNWCTLCGKQLKTNRSFREHLLSHSNSKPYACKICAQHFVTVTRLRLHIQSNHEGKVPQKKGRRGSVSLHTRKKQKKNKASEEPNAEKKRLECSLCQAVLSNYATLNAHMHQHYGTFPYTCDKCDQTFLYSGGYTRHMLTHAEENQPVYSCHVCGKNFSQSSHLRHHMHMHAGTKPYSCEMCGKGYSGGLDLRNHYTRVHGLEVVATRVVKRNKYTVNIPASAVDEAISAHNSTARDQPAPAADESADEAAYKAAAAVSVVQSDVSATASFDPVSAGYSIVHHDIVASVLANASVELNT